MSSIVYSHNLVFILGLLCWGEGPNVQNEYMKFVLRTADSPHMTAHLRRNRQNNLRQCLRDVNFAVLVDDDDVIRCQP